MRGRYNISDSDHVWSSDWTIGHGNKIYILLIKIYILLIKIYILLIIDLSTRFVVASEVLERQPKGGDIVNLLMIGIRDINVVPKIFHTDCGGAYMSRELASFLKEKKIEHSHREGEESHFYNQVIERLNKKIWNELESLNWINSKSGIKRFIKASKEDAKFLIKSVIEKINLDKPGNWTEGNPQELYARLSEQPRKYGIMASKDTQEGKWVKHYQEYVIIQTRIRL